MNVFSNKDVDATLRNHDPRDGQKNTPLDEDPDSTSLLSEDLVQEILREEERNRQKSGKKQA